MLEATKVGCSLAKQRQRNVQKSVLHVQNCFLLIRPIIFFAVLSMPSPFGITRFYFCARINYRYFNESFAFSPTKFIYYEDLNSH